MKVLLPENIADITLGKFQEFQALKDKSDKNKLLVYLGLDADTISVKDFKECLNQLNTALEQEAPFTDRFVLNGVKYGFVSNLDKISIGEYTDIKENNYTEVDNLHKLMAVLYRPVIKEDVFNNYEIEEYNGTGKYADIMKQIPLSIVNGVLFFFLNLSKDLQESILKYTAEVQARAKLV